MVHSAPRFSAARTMASSPLALASSTPMAFKTVKGNSARRVTPREDIKTTRRKERPSRHRATRSTPSPSTLAGVFMPSSRVKCSRVSATSNECSHSDFRTVPPTSLCWTRPPAQAFVGNAVVPVHTTTLSAPFRAVFRSRSDSSSVTSAMIISGKFGHTCTFIRKSYSASPALQLRTIAVTQYPSSSNRAVTTFPTLPEAPTTAALVVQYSFTGSSPFVHRRSIRPTTIVEVFLCRCCCVLRGVVVALVLCVWGTNAVVVNPKSTSSPVAVSRDMVL
mmetsp:Transcript_2834/g.8534  ORF Transcript_2834/g.8534 Transcript_2834/m.8534 type:complete len:277 (+) Transcript_2834:555-1385(+)